MRRHQVAWIAAGVLVVMLGFIVVLATGSSSGTRRASSLLLGRQAPPIVGETLDGSNFDHSSARRPLRGGQLLRHVVRPCIREHPGLVEFSEGTQTPMRWV